MTVLKNDTIRPFLISTMPTPTVKVFHGPRYSAEPDNFFNFELNTGLCKYFGQYVSPAPKLLVCSRGIEQRGICIYFWPSAVSKISKGEEGTWDGLTYCIDLPIFICRQGHCSPTRSGLPWPLNPGPSLTKADQAAAGSTVDNSSETTQIVVSFMDNSVDRGVGEMNNKPV